MSNGFIYCIRNNDEKDTYKIGYTKNYKQRLKQLQNPSGLSCKLNLEYILIKYVKDYKKKEKLIHKYCEEVRITKDREWFVCSLCILFFLFEIIDGFPSIVQI